MSSPCLLVATSGVESYMAAYEQFSELTADSSSVAVGELYAAAGKLCQALLALDVPTSQLTALQHRMAELAQANAAGSTTIIDAKDLLQILERQAFLPVPEENPRAAAQRLAAIERPQTPKIPLQLSTWDGPLLALALRCFSPTQHDTTIYLTEVIREAETLLRQYQVTLYEYSSGKTDDSPAVLSGHSVLCPRSTWKPLQAYALVKALRERDTAIASEELAIICSSHSGSAKHVAIVRRILSRIEMDATDLHCGTINPFALESGDRSPLQSWCSGKHAGFLWLAHLLGVPKETYLDHDGTVQMAVRQALYDAAIIEKSEIISWRKDGCAAPAPYLRTGTLARLYAKLIAGEDPILTQITQAMQQHHELVGNHEGRLVTKLMRHGLQGPKDLIAKDGADGTIAIGLSVNLGSADSARQLGLVLTPNTLTGNTIDDRRLAWLVAYALSQHGLLTDSIRQSIRELTS